MPTYSYQAINESGSIVTGEVEAESTDMANNILSARGYLPSKVVEKGQVVSSVFVKRLKERFTSIKAPELILFTKQFKTLIQGGRADLENFQGHRKSDREHGLEKYYPVCFPGCGGRRQSA